ncbi:MAG: hypothetical protein AAGI70_10875 [Pseudomonadota bacterium]
MLTSSQLSIAISAVLAAAILFGWMLHWLWARARRQISGEAARLHAAASRVDTAERARERAEAAQLKAETDLATREAALTADLAATEKRWQETSAEREAAFDRDLREARAEAAAAMEGLGTLRRRISELEAGRDGPPAG